MKKLAASILLYTILTLTLGVTDILADQTADPITDCPAGLVCLTPTEAKALRSQELDLRQEIAGLQRDLAVSKAKRLRRFGSVIGCGGGIVATNLADTADAGVYCGYMWGFRF